RGDGTPTYHFATVVDDHDFGVDFVIRGQDHVSNTLRQITLYNCLGWDGSVPRYAHVGLIHQGGKKLSKRDGAASLLAYRDRGYAPDAVLNYLLRLGWGPGPTQTTGLANGAGGGDSRRVWRPAAAWWGHCPCRRRGGAAIGPSSAARPGSPPRCPA